MSNLFRQYIESKPVRASLVFGHNYNIIVASVDYEERKGKEAAIRANTFITLHQVDPITREVKARFEGSFWDLDPASDFVMLNYDDQFSTMVCLVDAVGGDLEQFVSDFIDAAGIEDGVITRQHLSTKKGAKVIQDALRDAFKTALEGKIGDACPLLQCKMVSNKKGFLEFGKEANWIIPMNSDLKLPAVTAKEKEVYEAAQNEPKPTQAEPDKVGEAPGEKKVSSPAFDSI